jgi:hypothetical protein
MNRFAIGVLALLAGMSGCASPARYVQKNPDSVTIAIPENTDVWPTHYRAAAEALAKQHLGTNCVAVDEKEVATGAINNASPSANAAPAGKEWRITYMKKPLQPGIPMGGPLPGAIGMRSTLPGAGLGAGVQPAGGNVPPGAYTPGSLTGANTTMGANTMSATMGNPVVPSVAPPGGYQFSAPAR